MTAKDYKGYYTNSTSFSKSYDMMRGGEVVDIEEFISRVHIFDNHNVVAVTHTQDAFNIATMLLEMVASKSNQSQAKAQSALEVLK